MVKENVIIPKENLAQVEEVRELEDKSQKQEPTITESIKEAVLPTVHASDNPNEEVKEGLGEVHDEGAKKPAEWLGEAGKEIGEGIKKVFD